MKRVLQIVAVLALGAGGYWVWMWMHPSPEVAIRKELAGLAESLVSKAGEGNIARVAGINRTLSYFTSDIVINGEGTWRWGDAIQGRTELQQALFAARQRLEGAIEFADVRIQVGSETNATATLTAVGRLAGHAEPFTQDLKTHFVKVEGDWKISRVDPITLPPVKQN